MKGNNSSVLRVIYIILVPVVLLIILLNSGWLQRLLPAATVHGESYSVVRYNFYYFDYYNDFLETNADNLEELGYDSQESASQQTYDGSISWKTFFQNEAETDLAETAYYCDLADAAGYEFSQEELAPVQEALAANEAERTQYGISSNNYYLSYYGAGMNESRFTEELTKKAKAQAYKAHLIAEYTPEESEIASWLDEHPEDEYPAVEIEIITLDALPDRATGEVGAEQLSALQAKLNRLEERYESGTTFEELQRDFSTCTLGDIDGNLTATNSAELPDALTSQLLTDQSALSEGETFTILDKENSAAYFIRIVSLAESGPRADAISALSKQAIEEQEAAALADYTVKQNSLGMMLATS